MAEQVVTVRQKMQYIFRHHEILAVDQNHKIYIMLKRSLFNNAIRHSVNNDVYVDLSEIKDTGIIDNIYNLVRQRKEEIKI